MKMYKLLRCRNGKEYRKAYNQYMCYCLRNNLLDELEAANKFGCMKLCKKAC